MASVVCRTRVFTVAAIAWIAAPVLSLLTPYARADFAIYTVGGDASCQFSQIQDAVDAAAAHPGEDYVWIASNQSYSGQHIVVTDQDVDIEGGFSDCNDFDPGTDKTTINGASGHSVLEIEGTSHVYLANVTITGGNLDGNHSGGGIYFGGSGGLMIQRTTINFNTAGFGGGIDFNGGIGPAALTLLSDTLIIANTATVSGGGIRMEGNSRLYALQPHTLIGYNHAPNGNGGGIAVIGPAQVDIGSPGFNGLAVIYDNDAQYGGGISINGGSEDEQGALARIFTTDPTNPVQVSDNTASHTGGGIYLHPFNDIVGDKSRATFCALDFRIEDNIAQEGAAIYADLDSSPTIGSNQISNVVLNNMSSNSLCTDPESPVALGAVECTQGVPCNTIAGNITEDNQGTPTAGATILIQTEGELSGDRVIMRGNHAAHAIRSFDPLTNAFSNCLIVDNTFSAEMLLVENEGTYSENAGDTVAQFNNCTIANNAIAGGSVFRSARGFGLQDSIVDQPGVPTLNYTDAAANLVVKHVLTNDRSTLPDTVYIEQGEPTFVDAAHGNYHLLPTSLGVDSAPTDNTTPTLDLDRKLRVVDLPTIANNFGPMDLGAYEIQLPCAVADTFFCNGFEIN